MSFFLISKIRKNIDFNQQQQTLLFAISGFSALSLFHSSSFLFLAAIALSAFFYIDLS